MQDIIRNSLSVFLASSVLDLYPGSKPLSGGITQTGFYHDFILKGKVDLVFLEERMRQKEDIKSFCMMGENAASYLEHFGYLDKAEEAKNFGKEVIDLAQVNGFITFRKGPFTKEKKFFKLYKVEEENGISRIFGAAFDEEKALKKYLKKIALYKKNNHCSLGERLDLFYLIKNEWIFSEKWILLKNFFLEFLKKKKNFLEVDMNLLKDNFEVLRKKGYKNFSIKIFCKREKHPFFTGMYNKEQITSFSEFIFLKKEEIFQEIISSIKLFQSVLEEFSLDYMIFLKEKFYKKIQPFCKNISIEKKMEKNCFFKIFIKDGQKWSHLGCALYEKKILKEALLERKYFCIEDLLCLILEKIEGKFLKYLQKN